MSKIKEPYRKGYAHALRTAATQPICAPSLFFPCAKADMARMEHTLGSAASVVAIDAGVTFTVRANIKWQGRWGVGIWRLR